MSSPLDGIWLAAVMALAGCGDDSVVTMDASPVLDATSDASTADASPDAAGDLGVELVEYRRGDDWTSPTNEVCVVLRADPAVTADSVTLLGVELGSDVAIGPEGTTLCAMRCWSFSPGATDELVITRGAEMQVIDIPDSRHCG